MRELLLVYDCITSGLSASLFHAEGRLIAQSAHPLDIDICNTHAEQDPEGWWQALCRATQDLFAQGGEADARNVAAISFSAQSQVCLCLDAAGTPLYPAITWSDTRADEVDDPIAAAISPARHYALTGLPNEASSSIRKLLWLREKHPDIYKNTRCMIQCKDYLAYKLTGALYTDCTDASSTHALDLRTMDWCDAILGAADISREILPPILPSSGLAGVVSEAAARLTGLCPETPVAIGAGDVLCAAVGAGCVTPGQVYLSLGSSSWMAQCRVEPIAGAPDVINNPHAVAGRLLCFAPMQEAGVTFKWLKNEALRYGAGGRCPVEPFKNIYPYTGMAALACQSPAGANGLTFIPRLLGAGGAILGLRYEHTQADIVRAALEGICFEWKRLWELFAASLSTDTITVTGTGAGESCYLQLLSDMLGVPLRNTTLVGTPDAIGAAVIAGVAVGLYPDFDQASRFYRFGDVFYPDPDRNALYQRLYAEYNKKKSCLGQA